MDLKDPVYALPAASPDEPQLNTVEAMAERMVKIIRSIQPKGPYRIVGYCFGGLLAYEIAYKLFEAGQRVAFLGLIDTYYSSWLRNNGSLISERPSDAEALLDACASTAKTDDRRLVFTELCRVAETCSYHELARKSRALIPENWRNYSVPQLNYSANARYRFCIAAKHYFARPLESDLHLFVTEESQKIAPFLGWCDVVPEEQINTTEIPGAHSSIITGPSLEFLAAALAKQVNCHKSEAQTVNSVL
jgi:thioesterase domain-containing protein